MPTLDGGEEPGPGSERKEIVMFRVRSPLGLTLLVMALAVIVTPPARSQPLSDFDDGTLQEWTRLLPFNGSCRTPGPEAIPADT
jgi:hypothetical protein